MPRSQNGWPASQNLKTRVIEPVKGCRLRIVDNDNVDAVFTYLVQQFHKRVDDVTKPHPADDWGFYYRANRNDPNSLSNHSSGTAIDLDATEHPNGVSTGRTYTVKQIAEVHKILAELDGVVRWGGDYTHTVDAMHFEINVKPGRLQQIGKKLRQKLVAVTKKVTKVVKKPVKKPAPKPQSDHFDFRVHLAPGQKTKTAKQIMADMRKAVAKTHGNMAVLFNTERDTKPKRNAVLSGLGKGWRRVLENENTIAYKVGWKQAAKPVQILLAKEDPSMAHVSPNRWLSKVPLQPVSGPLKKVVFKMNGTHLLSEANCEHVHINGRAWREKMWPVQLNDVIEWVEWDHRAGQPVVLAGDFNTGIHFTGAQVKALLDKKFPGMVTHVHNGKLDHIFLISTPNVKLEEIGKEVLTNNNSDHDMVTALIRATLR